MNHLSKEEVLEILENADFYIFDELEWRTTSHYNGQVVYKIDHGLVDENGDRTDFVMSLQIKEHLDYDAMTSVFTLLREGENPARIYQLEIKKLKKLKQIQSDEHMQPHEHMGGRIRGDLSWLNWSFEQRLALFLKRCRIKLSHQLNDPQQSSWSTRK